MLSITSWDRIKKQTYKITAYRDKIRTLFYDRDFVGSAPDDNMKKKEEFKNVCTSFRLFGLEMSDKVTNITQQYFVAIANHLESADRLPVLNKYLVNTNGTVTTLQF